MNDEEIINSIKDIDGDTLNSITPGESCLYDVKRVKVLLQKARADERQKIIDWCNDNVNFGGDIVYPDLIDYLEFREQLAQSEDKK